MGNKRLSNKRFNIKYSISLKLTLIVVFLSILIILALSLINIHMQMANEKKILDEESKKATIDFARSHAILSTIEKNITSYKQFNDTEYLQYFITNEQNSFNNISNETKILRISINKIDNQEIIVYASTDLDYLESTPNTFNTNSSITGDTYYILNETEPEITIISPINLSGNIVGTYELTIYMPPKTLSYDTQIQYFTLISFIGVLILIMSLLFLLRKIIVQPIITFKNTAKVIGKGKLDTKVKIQSKDELGELADAFNQMAKDLKESRDKIEDYNKILEKLLEQKDEFIGQLGHDLKNPMQPLVGLLPILIEKEKNPDNKEMLEVMHTNVEYMQELIFDTLKLAKLRSDNIDFNYENLNLKKEVEKVVKSQKTMLKEKNIKIEDKIKDDIFVYADKLRLSEIFKNLINNSVKYTDESGGKISIDAEREENDFVKISIKDTGIGMTEDQIKKVFDEFYKADRQTSDYHSTGLGLAICKRIVEKHGGKIWVKSEGPNKGSTFYFTIKAKK